MMSHQVPDLIKMDKEWDRERPESTGSWTAIRTGSTAGEKTRSATGTGPENFHECVGGQTSVDMMTRPSFHEATIL